MASVVHDPVYLISQRKGRSASGPVLTPKKSAIFTYTDLFRSEMKCLLSWSAYCPKSSSYPVVSNCYKPIQQKANKNFRLFSSFTPIIWYLLKVNCKERWKDHLNESARKPSSSEVLLALSFWIKEISFVASGSQLHARRAF